MKNAGQAKNVFVSSDFQYSGFRGESKGDRFYSMIDMMCYIDTKVYERKRIILNNME